MAGHNRLFVLLALFLVGLLVLGLIVTGGVVAFNTFNQAQKAANPTATTTAPALAKAPTPTLALTSSPTPKPTKTKLPTRTRTPVTTSDVAPTAGADMGVQAEIGGPLTPTAVMSPAPGATPASQETTPDTGIGGLEAVLIAAGLVGILIVSRRLRSHA
jgi:hypothetical protein